MVDINELLREINDEIDYAIADETRHVAHYSPARPYAHAWAKGYRKGLQFARDKIQEKMIIDLRESSDEPDGEVHYRPPTNGTPS